MEIAKVQDCETVVSGKRLSEDVGEIEDSLGVTSNSSSIEATVSDGNISVLVTGTRNSIKLKSVDEKITVRFDGNRNTIYVGNEVEIDTQGSGTSNSVKRREFDVESSNKEGLKDSLVQQTKEEAYASLGIVEFSTVRYQNVVEKETCPFCKRDADIVVKRHQETGIYLFGRMVSKRDSHSSFECPGCAPITDDDVKLDEDEEDRIYRQ